jgi:rRNA maturation endonuclease Nob1
MSCGNCGHSITLPTTDECAWCGARLLFVGVTGGDSR